jgi:orotate phosphoribosyltransferase
MHLVELLAARQALRFGNFTLKSGRSSPYFVNFGTLCHGGDLAILGEAYAERIIAEIGDHIDVVFGPAYKGIPLAVATAAALERRLGRPIGWSFDRKEAKDHGDGGLFVGAPLKAGVRVVLVDDVLTAGTAVRASLERLAPTGITLAAIVIALDRQERGSDSRTAVQELQEHTGVPVLAVTTISEAVERLQAAGRLDAAMAATVRSHLAAQGH